MDDDKRPSFTVDVPRDFTHRFADVFTPGAVNPNGPPRYGCCFPASELPADLVEEGAPGTWRSDGYQSHVKEREGVPPYVRATSLTAPVVLPRSLDPDDLARWQHLLTLCDLTGMPRGMVFRERLLRLAVRPYDWKHAMAGKGISLRLEAVQVLELDDGPLRRRVLDAVRG